MRKRSPPASISFVTEQFPPGAPPDAGLTPDVPVETTPADVAAGRDPVRLKLASLWASEALSCGDCFTPADHG